MTCILVLKLDLIDEFFQTAGLPGQHSMEVQVLNEPVFSVVQRLKNTK